MKKINNTGIVSPLILVGMAVVVVFLLVAYSGPFTSQLLGTIFPKNVSFASEPGAVFVNSTNQPITQTTAPAVKVMLTPPWSIQGQAMAEPAFNLMSEANAQTASTVTLTASGNANEDGNVSIDQGKMWVGNGKSTAASFAGIRFSGVNIPRGAVITSAKLSVYSTQNQWINVSVNIYGDNSGNSAQFSTSSKPSQRSLTSSLVSYSQNVRWNSNATYEMGDIRSIVQQIVSRSDWNSGNNISLVMKGTGGAYARKNISGKGSTAPKLVITYSGSGGVLPSTSSVSSVAPSATPVATPTPTPNPYVVSARVAEDPAFTKNVIDVNPFIKNPTTIDYVFSDTSLGVKTIYAKFVSSAGEEKVFSSTVELVQASAAPSPVPSASTTTKNIWGAVDPLVLGNCSAAVHDKYLIDGGDGFYYRTWHSQVDPSGCVFAHEHGDNPDNMTDTWVRQNWDGRFGYAARRMTSAAEPNGHAEAHEGYKVFVANIGLTNDEGRINRTATISSFHMGTSTPKRLTIQHHSNSLAYRYQSGAPYAATHLMMDTGGVSDVCDPRAAAPTKDAMLLQNRCKVNSGYEIWGTFQTIKNGSKEVYRAFATPAVFDPITVFNKDNPTEVVYAWDPRVAAIKNFNDDWSGNRGCVRENYAQVGYFYNSGGQTTYYTDPMGMVVSQTDPMAIKQTVSASDVVGLASTQDNLQFKKKTDYCQSKGNLGLKN